MLTQDTDLARFNMIAQQIRPWDVNDDRVLDVMQSLPRENFVPEAYAGLAYADIEIPLGSGEVMLSPKIEARMMQALDIKPTDHILEIGTGSGYLTACLAKLGNFVVSYDQHGAMTAIARENLDQLGIKNIRLETGNIFTTKLPAQSFDVIAITGSLPAYNKELQGLLKNGGRMFSILGADPVMEAMLFVQVDQDHLSHQSLFETSVPALSTDPVPGKFVF